MSRPGSWQVVFAGRTTEGEEITVYMREEVDEGFIPKHVVSLPAPPEIHIRRPDGEKWALSPGSTVTTWGDFDEKNNIETINIKIDSPEWSGEASGTVTDLINAPPY
jgi:hypothetical protein